MALKHKSKIFPHLWYAREAEEAAAFYTSIFPDSRIDRVAMLHIRANDQYLALALNATAVGSARVVKPLTGHFGFHIIFAGEVFAGIFDLEKFKLCAHPV